MEWLIAVLSYNSCSHPLNFNWINLPEVYKKLNCDIFYIFDEFNILISV